jgi:hypothetical protein
MKFSSMFIVLVTLIIVTGVGNLSSSDRFVIRLSEPAPDLVAEFSKDNYDIAAYKPGEFLDLVVTERQLTLLKSKGFDPQITQTEAILKNNLQLRTRTLDGYRTYDEVLNEIQTLALEHEEIVRIYNIGDSWGKIYTQEGNDYYSNYQHDIWAVKVTTDPDSLNDKPAVYYMGAHHAREPLSTEVPMDFLNLLLDNYDTDDEIAYLIENTEIWFIPLINPDGHKIVLNETDVWWRKNIRDNNNNSVFDTMNYYGYGVDGVDLNRNYEFEWASGSNLSAPTYPGPAPASEPEIAVLQQLMIDNQFVAGITYHTYSELVLFPFGYADGVAGPDAAALEDLAVEMAVTIPKLNSAGHYDPIPSWDLYPANGTTDDYAYGKHGIFSYTFELGVEFIPPPADVQQISEDNMAAALILLKRIHRSTLTGHITNAVTNEPLVAEIFIEGIDDTGVFREPYRSNEDFGRYYRILLPGEYNITFSTYGFNDSGPHTITITENEQTILDSSLYPSDTVSISGIVNDFTTGLPISNAVVSLTGTPLEPALTDNEGFFSFETVSMGTYQISITADGYGLHEEEITATEPENFFSFYLSPPYLVDNFETLDNWITSGGWGLSEQYAYQGNFSLADSPYGDYQSNTSSFARLSDSIDLNDATNASLSFLTRYALEPGYDYCYLQASTDGSDWLPLATFNGLSDWTLKEYYLNDFLGEELFLRFYFTSDQYVEDEGIYIDSFTIYVSSPGVDTDDESIITVASKLYNNYPNPFNPETTLSFSIKEKGRVVLEVFNIKGQKIRSLINEEMNPGFYDIVWDGNNENNMPVGSGMYFYRLQHKEFSSVKKMILLK